MIRCFLMESYDVVIIGASFSGLTLAHHLPQSLRVLIIDTKPSAGSTVESTGLITERTRQEFASFFDIDSHITNPITAICVIAPNFTDHFISETDHAWINQTDTKALIRDLAAMLPPNVTRLQSAVLLDAAHSSGHVTAVTIGRNGSKVVVETRFLVGADGGRSKVAQLVPGLDRNERFLFGYEQVFFGNVHLGPKPAETIYHYWFGEFSLGYGGWLSPTVVDGKPAFRIGLAKLMQDRGEAKDLMKKFLEKLLALGHITVAGSIDAPGYVFGSMIPIGGVRRRYHAGNVLLVGDAAGFNGAFAADGIKGSVVSGKEGAALVGKYLHGETNALGELHARMDAHNNLMEYYHRQLRYRWIWDQMKSNRTFDAMYRVIEAERASFLDQFCDSKDKRKSLARVVIKPRHFFRLLKYAGNILLDYAHPRH